MDRDRRNFARLQRGAIESAPSSMAVILFSEAVNCHRDGKLNDADRLCRRILELCPRHAESLHLLGAIAYQTSRYDMAVEMIRSAIRIDNRNAPYHSDLGLSLQAQGKLDAAVAQYKRALGLKPDYPEAHYYLGNALRDQGKTAEAAARYEQALKLRPGYALACSSLGSVLRGSGRMDEAVRLYERALSFQPHNAQLHLTLGLTLCAQDKLPEAVEHYERAVALDPTLAEAHYNLGLALYSLDKLDEAVTHYEKALSLRPGMAEAHNNLGITLDARNDPEVAIIHYKQAILFKPDLTEAYYNMAMSQLKSGDFSSGWDNYEWRWHSTKSSLTVRNFSQPQWRGEPLEGARILLHAEQGLGDTIQFLRYVPMVQAAGGAVVLEVQKGMYRLASQLGVETISFGNELPSFDWHCPLLSLPLALGTTLETVPNRVPYLSIPEEALRSASALPWPTQGLRVGLAWAGNQTFLNDRYRYRSIPFPLLSPLFLREDIQLFSLQIGEATAELGTTSRKIFNLAPHVTDMADTAAQMAHLDIVVSVDTAVAHLAGALGVATLTMLPYASDWRWLTGRGISRWYPTMGLFRQPEPGDWKPVVNDVCRALREFPLPLRRL